MRFRLPGANGLEVRGDIVYVSNTARRTILTIPIRRDGSAGPALVRHRDLEADDFAFAPARGLVVAENPPSTLVRVAPGGEVTTLATSADGLDNPSAVAFEPNGRLYVTKPRTSGHDQASSSWPRGPSRRCLRPD